MNQRKLIGLMLVLPLITSMSLAAVYDIFPTADDTFSSRVSTLNPGDTVIVHAGTYYSNGVKNKISVVGTAVAPVLIKGAPGEARPVITRRTTASIENTIDFEGNASYVTLSGLELVGNGSGSDGVNMHGANSYLTIENLVIHEVDVGINFRTNMNHITVRGNHIYNTGRDGNTGEGMYIGCNDATCIVSDSLIEGNWIHDALPGTTQGDGIELKVGSYNNVIRNNVVYNRPNGYPGIFVYGTNSQPVNIVEGNVVWNCGEGISALSEVIVRNNIVFNSGSAFGSYNHVQVANRSNITFINNTGYNNTASFDFSGSATAITVANNAFYSPGKSAVSGSPSGTIVNNYVEGSVSSGIDGTKYKNGGNSANAFVNPAANDFWPKPGSPLIGNATTANLASNDFNGTTRTNPSDVGAYHTAGLAANPGWKIVADFKTSTPTDTNPPAKPKNFRTH